VSLLLADIVRALFLCYQDDVTGILYLIFDLNIEMYHLVNIIKTIYFTLGFLFDVYWITLKCIM